MTPGIQTVHYFGRFVPCGEDKCPYKVSLTSNIIFTILNMISVSSHLQISNLFKTVADPFRVALLLALSKQEACVCHLETLLGKRQAYISQHLMSLREAGMLSTRRRGKFVFYKLKDHRLLNLIRRAAEIQGVNPRPPLKALKSKCACPHCAPSTN